MLHHIKLFLLLCGLWLMLSGMFEPLLLGLGLLSCLFVLYLSARMDIIDHQAELGKLSWSRMLRYWSWLLLEIAHSCIDVTRVILSRELPISPGFVRLPTSQKTDMGRAIYANSITLTPGTITVDVDAADNSIEVHALTSASAESLQSGDMDQRTSAVER